MGKIGRQHSFCKNVKIPFDAPGAAAYTPHTTPAQVAELVDALASGASIGNDVEVRVLSWAPLIPRSFRTLLTPTAVGGMTALQLVKPVAIGDHNQDAVLGEAALMRTRGGFNLPFSA